MVLKIDKTLYDTYRQYKTEERTLVDWLVRTSRKCSGTAFFKNGQSVSTSTETIPIYDILPMVRVIADHPSIERIPHEISCHLRSVTSKRAHCNTWYRNNTDPEDTETQRINRSHDYPLAVLRKAMQLLQDKLPQSPPKVLDTRAELLSMSDSSSSVDVVEHLEIEDYNEVGSAVERLTVETRSSGSQMPSASSIVDKRCMALANEVKLLRYRLLQDMETLEAAVIQEWASYLTGSQTLTGASAIANHAVSLVTQLESNAFQSLTCDCEQEELGPLAFIATQGLSEFVQHTDNKFDQHPILRMQQILPRLLPPQNEGSELSEMGQIKDLDYFAADTGNQTLYEAAIMSAFVNDHVDNLVVELDEEPETQAVRLFRWLWNRITKMVVRTVFLLALLSLVAWRS